MTSLALRSIVGAATALAVLAPTAAPAVAKKKAPPTEAIYAVTFKAELKEAWSYNEEMKDDCNLTGDMCVRVGKGQGTTKMNLQTKRPHKMLVMRGIKGRGPSINVGTGEGAPVTGGLVRTGSLTTDWSGPWDAGNPDQRAKTDGCGTHNVKGDVNFTWQGRNQLAPSLVLDEPDGPCPTGPSDSWQWKDDESPSLSDAIAQAAESKFLRTKQFTVSGTKAWSAQIDPINQTSRLGSYVKSGQKTAQWQWTATFRMVKRRG